MCMYVHMLCVCCDTVIHVVLDFVRICTCVQVFLRGWVYSCRSEVCWIGLVHVCFHVPFFTFCVYTYSISSHQYILPFEEASSARLHYW